MADDAIPTAELYDPLFHTPQADLYDIYATLRRDHPVYHNKERGVWCLTRYSDVQSAARDWKTFGTEPGVDIDVPNWMGSGNFIDADPPRHDVLRNVARPYFVPKAIAALEADIARRVDTIMADLREHPSADLAHEFAWGLPIWVISRLLGAPEEDDDTVQRLVLDAFAKSPGETALPERAAAGIAELHAYLLDLAAHKRKHPDDRILSGMVAGQASGAPAAHELAGMATMFYVAGSETTFALLGNALVLLAENPAAAQALRHDPAREKIEAAIEEAVRFEAPVQYLARTLRAPTTLHGVEIAAGERVVLIFAAANRDPERWERPDEFDIDRQQMRHVGFGEGIHFCIGAPLARLEARIALPAFLETFADYQIGSRKRLHSHVVRGWERLDATLVPSG